MFYLIYFMNQPGNTGDESGTGCLIEYTMDSSQPATEAVVDAVATVSDTSAEELSPLYEAVETDALDQLVAPRIHETSRTDVTVEFTYSGKLVSVNGQTIRVYPLEEDATSTYS